MLLYCGFGSSSSAGSSSGEDLVVEGFAPLGAEGVGVEGLRGLGVTGGAVGDGLVSPPFKASNLCFAAFPQSSHRDLTPSDYSLLKKTKHCKALPKLSE